MIIHQRETGCGPNYPEVFEALLEAKAYLENKYPEISIELKCSLAEQRGRATIQTRHAWLADHERIDAEVDNAHEFAKPFEPARGESVHPAVDQFYLVNYNLKYWKPVLKPQIAFR
jgi:hypothetical protein